jgi:uncharacterized membrane protein
MITDVVSIIAILFLIVALSEYLNDKPYFKHIGTGLMVIIFGAIFANVGVIPASSPASPVYDVIFSIIAPLSIFLMLLNVNLNSVKKAGKPMLIMFFIGSIASVVGTFVAIWLIDGKETIGDLHYAIGGMFTGTYIGGSMNYNAVALNYDVAKEGGLYSAATVADNIMSAVWVIVTLTLPQILNKFFPRKTKEIEQTDQLNAVESSHTDKETVSPFDIAFLLLLGLAAVQASTWLNHQIPFIPFIIWLTTLALILAQIPIIHRLKGHKLLGLICIYLFLTVIGAYCDIPALLQDGKLAIILLSFVTIIVFVHGLIIYCLGAVLKQDWDIISIASQANIGGTATALALAKSLKRSELILPAILVGAVGNALGSYFGIFVAEILKTIG